MFFVFSPDQIPYVESGTYVAYNNEKGGVIRSLIEDGFVDLDSQVRGIPEWISAKAMVDSWLADAILYELWVGSDGSSAHKIYYSDLPWPLGKILYLKQVHVAKQILGVTKDNAERREEEVICFYWYLFFLFYYSFTNTVRPNPWWNGFLSMFLIVLMF